jgi:hypothetical protein
MNRKPQVGAIGVLFTMTILREDGVTPVDLSSATTKTARLYAPDGTSQTQTLGFINSGTDGKVGFTTALASDLHVAGTWRIQCNIAFSGSSWPTSVGTFVVEGNLP